VARIGLVAEGPGDFAFLQAVVSEVLPHSEVRQIHPDATLASAFGNGWKGVRAWCQENGSRLETIMGGIEGDELDVLVVHADCSMAHNVGARHPCPPASATVEPLQDVIVTQWLGFPDRPRNVVLMTPAQSTDTWFFVGAGYADDPTFEPLECSTAIEAELARLRHYRWKRGEIRKSRLASEQLASLTATAWGEVVTKCHEAKRFADALSAAVA
jgi:hypothetical protein